MCCHISVLTQNVYFIITTDYPLCILLYWLMWPSKYFAFDGQMAIYTFLGIFSISLVKQKRLLTTAFIYVVASKFLQNSLI